MAGVKAKTIYNAGMAFCIINNYVMTAAKHIYQTHHSLVTIIKQDGIFFTFKSCKLCFQLFMVIAVPTHHACTHWKRETKIPCTIRICFSYFGVVCQPQVIIQAPNDHFLATKTHSAAYSAFQFRECKITMGSLTVLPYRSVILEQTFK